MQSHTIERLICGGECRAENRRLSGVAIGYRDVSPSHKERFSPGSFNLADQQNRWLNLRHNPFEAIAWTSNGTLALRDTNEALNLMVEEVPDTPAGNHALTGLRSGELKGLSIEFNALEETRENGLRVITRANLLAIGLVENPSYPQSQAENRSKMGKTMRSSVPSGEKLQCNCNRKVCDTAEFDEEALDDIVDKITRPGNEDVIAGTGSSYTDKPNPCLLYTSPSPRDS